MAIGRREWICGDDNGDESIKLPIAAAQPINIVFRQILSMTKRQKNATAQVLTAPKKNQISTKEEWPAAIALKIFGA